MSRAKSTLDLYRDKTEGYFSGARLDLLELVEGKGLAILEVGAGTGATLRVAKERGLASYAVAVDIVRPEAPEPMVDQFLVGSIEELTPALGERSFDVVLLGDVLEHLIDPRSAVSALASKLKPGGAMIASLPNARNFRFLSKIVFRGDFGYERAGLFDETHLRFFCRRNAVELFESAGLEVLRVAENMGAYGLRHRAIDFVTARKLHEFFVLQYRIVARGS